MSEDFKKNKRIFQALFNQGLDVSYEDGVFKVKHRSATSDLPVAEVLLPLDFKLEEKALQQLVNLTLVKHPEGGQVCRVCATPDFHPGDSGIAIGSVIETKDILIPAAIGKDINCGMRFHVSNLDLEEFLSKKSKFVELLKGDYLLGTRDVEMTTQSMQAMFEYGLSSWLEEVKKNTKGFLKTSNLDLILSEVDKVMSQGSMLGDLYWVPEKLIPESGCVRDDGLGTIGRGNHFVEVQVVEEILDGYYAHALGIKAGQIAFMIHSGSRNIGMYIGKRWQEKAQEAWPKGIKHPESGIFPIKGSLIQEYLMAEATAANYGFVNRVILAELMRNRIKQVYGDLEVPLISDISHNITLFENGHYVARKGACPAYKDQLVIIPGSMGTASYLLMGNGNERFISSASHGAGRNKSRNDMGRFVQDEEHLKSLGLNGVECITLREERRIEEAPAAYKPIQPIIDIQVKHGLVNPIAKMSPILTFKA